MKIISAILAVLFLMISSAGISQQISGVEYFFNTDPGIGNGTAVAVTDTGDSVVVNLAIDISDLSPGFQELYVRTRNTDGTWSLSEARAFYIVETNTYQPSAQLVEAEYFYNIDPGTGMANAFTLTTSVDSVEEFHDIPLGDLSPGFHELNVRVRDAAGLWSLAAARSFYVLESNFAQEASAVAAAEYFFDADPGIGEGTPLSLNEGDSINEMLNINLPALEAGFHELFVRVKNASGIWSIVERRPFYVLETASLNPSDPIASAEYFFDTDPGIGNGIAIANALSSDTVNLNFNIDLTGRALGEDTLYVRVIDEAGVSSLYEYALFEIADQAVDIETIDLIAGDTVVQPGSAVDISYGLTNSGDLDLTDEFSVDTYISMDEMLSEDDVLLSSQPVNDDIAIGATLDRKESFSIADTISAGEVFILVNADGQNSIPEFNDDNNTASVSLIIASSPEINDQTFAVDERIAPGTLVDTIVASHPENDSLTYSILSGNTNQAFALEGTTGKLTVNNSDPLDFETTPSFNLIVQVDDGSGGSAQANITINLNDVDEGGNPVIDDQIFTMDENSSNGTVVGTVEASDPDGDTLTFSLISGNANEAFALGASSGELTVNDSAQLDFETTPSFNIVVQVDDGNGGTEQANITISLIDVDETTGIDGINLSNKVTVYPNPSDGFILINTNELFNNADYKLYNVNGEVMMEGKVPAANQFTIVLPNPSGVYLMALIKDGEYALLTIVKR